MRTSARFAGVAAAAVAALLVSGCSSGSDDGGDKGSETPKADQTKAPDGGGDAKVGADQLEGGWSTDATHADEGLRILAVSKGSAMLTGKSTCTGKATDAGLALKCNDGNTDFATGQVQSLEGKKLVIKWASGKEDTFTKTPNDIPTDLGDLPENPEDLPTPE
ncbi:hypothetical protein G5C51_18670 [Streptomyces sp. A7024]|uniref:Lipoprotein n=1 Tax=Streptomyces coryli TaxID=1128680 RepID=A0A6G4U3V7_9ACTN|nr:hypothetical protein [Streptomyces coryli]NGN65911.1 hypothetical protein [Streptomyces coryli]